MGWKTSTFFIQRLQTFFYFCYVFTFFNVFYFFWNVFFYIYGTDCTKFTVNSATRLIIHSRGFHQKCSEHEKKGTVIWILQWKYSLCLVSGKWTSTPATFYMQNLTKIGLQQESVTELTANDAHRVHENERPTAIICVVVLVFWRRTSGHQTLDTDFGLGSQC